MEKLDVSLLKSYISKSDLDKYISNELIDFMLKNNQELIHILNDVFKDYKNKKVSSNLLNFNDILIERIIMRYIDINNIDVGINIDEKINKLKSLNNIMLSDSLYYEYTHLINNFPLLNRKEEEYLFKEYNYFKSNNDLKKAKIIKDIIIECNLSIVVSIATKYSSKYHSSMDLIQEGNYALIKAIDSFDITKGNKFSSFVTNYIKNHLINYLKSKQDLKVSNLYVSLLYKIDRVNDLFLSKYNRLPSVDELSMELKVEKSKVSNAIKYKVDTFSYNETKYDSDDETEKEIIDFIPSKNVYSYEDIELKNKLYESIEKLTKKQKRVLFETYYEDKKEKEIAKELNVTHQDIGLTNKNAIKKLRKIMKQELEDYNE